MQYQYCKGNYGTTINAQYSKVTVICIYSKLLASSCQLVVVDFTATFVQFRLSYQMMENWSRSMLRGTALQKVQFYCGGTKTVKIKRELQCFFKCAVQFSSSFAAYSVNFGRRVINLAVLESVSTQPHVLGRQVNTDKREYILLQNLFACFLIVCCFTSFAVFEIVL